MGFRQLRLFFCWVFDRDASIQHFGKRLGAFHFVGIGAFQMEDLIFQVNVNQLAAVLFNGIFDNRYQVRFI
jgi:hypothetical protein